MIVFALFQVLFSEGQLLDNFLALGKTGAEIYILYQIVRIIEIPNPVIPEKITNFLYYLFIIAFVYFFIFTLSLLNQNAWKWTEENTLILAGTVQTMLWCAVWRTYFIRSRRVETFYPKQSAEDKKQTTRE